MVAVDVGFRVSAGCGAVEAVGEIGLDAVPGGLVQRSTADTPQPAAVTSSMAHMRGDNQRSLIAQKTSMG